MNPPPSTMTPAVREALAEARQRLDALYGDRLLRVILYGSQARGEAHDESDIDVLVVLRDDFDLFAEIKRLTSIKLDLLERYDVYFSFQPYTEQHFQERQSPFLINVRAEGVEL